MAAITIQDILGRPLQHVKEEIITFITKLLVVAYGALAIGLAYFAQSMDGPVTQLSGSVFGALGSPILGIIVMGAAVPWANKYGALAGAAVSLAINLWVSLGGALHASPLKPLPPITTEKCFELNTSLYKNGLSTVLYNMSVSHADEHGILPTTINYNIRKNGGPSDSFFLYDITYEWYPVIGCIVCIAFGLVVSLLTNPRQNGKSRFSVDTCSNEAKYIFPFLRSFWGFEDGLTNINKHRFETVKTKNVLPNENKELRNEHMEMETTSPLLISENPDIIQIETSITKIARRDEDLDFL